MALKLKDYLTKKNITETAKGLAWGGGAVLGVALATTTVAALLPAGIAVIGAVAVGAGVTVFGGMIYLAVCATDAFGGGETYNRQNELGFVAGGLTAGALLFSGVVPLPSSTAFSKKASVDFKEAATITTPDGTVIKVPPGSKIDAVKPAQ